MQNGGPKFVDEKEPRRDMTGWQEKKEEKRMVI